MFHFPKSSTRFFLGSSPLLSHVCSCLIFTMSFTIATTTTTTSTPKTTSTTASSSSSVSSQIGFTMPSPEVFFGSLLCVCSAVLAVAGVNLQKLAHVSIAAEARQSGTQVQVDRVSLLGPAYCDSSSPPSTIEAINSGAGGGVRSVNSVPKSHLHSAQWWAGLVIVALASLIDFIALAFAPQRVVAALCSLTLVANLYIAPRMLGEHRSNAHSRATFIILAGAVCIVLASGKSEQPNLDELYGMFRSVGFVLYMVTVCVFGAGMVALYLVAEHMSRDQKLEYFPTWARVHPLSIASLTGVVAAQTMLFAKAVSITLFDCFHTSDHSSTSCSATLHHPGPYILLACLTFCVVLQTHTLNIALKRFDSLIVLPVYTVVLISCSVFAGGMCFDEFAGIGYLTEVLFVIGAALVCRGTFSLANRPSGMATVSDTKGVVMRVVILPSSRRRSVASSLGVGAVGVTGGEQQGQLDHSTESMQLPSEENSGYGSIAKI